MGKPPSTAPCGDVRRYWAGCRCDECRAAATQYQRDRIERNGHPDKRKRKNTVNKHRTNAEVLARNERGEKQCNTCWEWQPEAQYYGLPASLDGLVPQCRTCQRLRRKGVTKQRVVEMLSDQGNRCAICPRIFYSFSDFHIDHDHSCCAGKDACGKCVRGLLCGNCNFRVMALIDDAELLQRGLQYAGRP